MSVTDLEVSAAGSKPGPKRHTAIPAAILLAAFIGVMGFSAWFLLRPQSLLIQGEVDATRTDIAARVDGRIGRILVDRGNDVQPNALLIEIDNPELLARLQEAKQQKAVADAELARINVGTRQEQIAQRRAALARAIAALTLAQQTYSRTKTLVGSGNSPVQKLDENTAELEVARRQRDEADLALQQALNGFTREEHGIAEANVKKAEASVATLQSLVDQLRIYAPGGGQIYQRNIEAGEFVLPGAPLLTIVDLGDMWVQFDLREDLLEGLKVGDELNVRIPALGNRLVSATVTVIASRGEYAGWRATRATGDFDLRTFEVRAHPAAPVEGLRPGMSVYAERHR